MGIFHQAPLKKSYFSLILSSMKQAYDTNETSPENQIICLQKKNFDTMTMTATHKFNTKNRDTSVSVSFNKETVMSLKINSCLDERQEFLFYIRKEIQ